jgi:sulfur-carrier protein
VREEAFISHRRGGLLRNGRIAVCFIPVAEPASNVTVHVFGQLREYCGGATELPVSARTVRSLLDQLEQGQPLLYRNLCDETGKVRRHLNVFVNTENVRDLDGLETTLAAGDVVTFLPAVSGG